MRMCGLGAVGCLLMIAGCAGTTAGPSPMPAALFLDLVATPQWKAEHEVYARWSGHEVKLPAYIRWQRTPSVITHGIQCDNGRVTAEYGSMRIEISARPEARLTAGSPFTEPGAAARRRAAIAYWAFGPLGPANEEPQWIDPTPAELSARLASGEVQTLTIFAP